MPRALGLGFGVRWFMGVHAGACFHWGKGRDVDCEDVTGPFLRPRPWTQSRYWTRHRAGHPEKLPALLLCRNGMDILGTYLEWNCRRWKPYQTSNPGSTSYQSQPTCSVKTPRFKKRRYQGHRERRSQQDM